MDWLLILLVAAIYFLPWLVAASRKHHNRGAICALNLFLGWTVVGWIVALVWAYTAVRAPESVEAREPCPFCAESILVRATVCPHCRRDIPEAVVQARVATAQPRDVKLSFWWLALGVGIPLLGMLLVWLRGRAL